MINSILVGGTLTALEEVFNENGIVFDIEKSKAYDTYKRVWENSAKKDLAVRQARPAIRRILEKEPYVFEKGGEPLMIRLNDQDRRMEDSFGEILLERADIDWRFALSVKIDAKIIASMPVAGRDMSLFMNKVDGMVNEIDDFGDRVLGIPCSNEYFDEMNEILLKIAPHDSDNWKELIRDDSFVYDTLITPMLGALGREMPRIFKDHPEAPRRLIEYFYRMIDYYYIAPIDKAGVTRIGAVNGHGDLGRIPGSDNNFTPKIKFPTQLLEVRPASGRYGELSKDTIQLSFDGGWSLCIMLRPVTDRMKGRSFELKVFMPSLPYGSYRDQVEWDPEA